LGKTSNTSGKGFLASKGTTKQAGTVFLAVNLVIDLTLLSSPLSLDPFLTLEKGLSYPNTSIASEFRLAVAEVGAEGRKP
jgi:hypothetical protein